MEIQDTSLGMVLFGVQSVVPAHPYFGDKNKKVLIFNDLGNIKNIEEKRDTSKKKKKTEKTEEEKALYKQYQKYIKSDEFKALSESDKKILNDIYNVCEKQLERDEFSDIFKYSTEYVQLLRTSNTITAISFNTGKSIY